MGPWFLLTHSPLNYKFEIRKEHKVMSAVLSRNPALALLKKDHDTVKDLFEKFEKAESRSAKKKIVIQALAEGARRD